MKIFLFIMFLSIGQLPAFESYSQRTTISLDFHQSKLVQVLDEIENQSDYFFLFNEKLVDVNRKVNIQVKDQEITKILDHLFEGTNIEFQIIDRKIVLSPNNKNLLQQPKNNVVRGNVQDSNGNPLPGVTIMVKGTTKGTVTDNDGNYSLPNVSGDDVIVFSFVGMMTQEVNIGYQSVINVMLSENVVGIEEVVAIGYGTESREFLTTAISKVDTLAFANIPYSNATNVLQGTTTGVRVTTNSGQPGSAPTIVIRGGTSLSPDGSYPLYVIDGIISPGMTSLNAQDIESVQILKDAASTAIYGARGSNGVVLITTKSAKQGKAVIEYSYNLSLSHYESNIEMLGARDYIYYQRLGVVQAARKWPFFEAFLSNATPQGTGNDLSNTTFYNVMYLSSENEYKLQEGWETMPDPIYPDRTIIFKNTDWRDIIFKTSISHNHNISAAGGTDKAKYRVSFGYLQDNGVAIHTGYKRLTFDVKGSVKVRDNISVNSSVSYFSGRTNGVYNEGDLFGRLLQIAPTAKYRYEDGQLAWGDFKGHKGNPEYRMLVTPQSSLTEQANYTIGGNWDILPGFSFAPKVSLITRNINSWGFTKAYWNSNSYDESRSASESNRRYYGKQADGVFTYNKTFKKDHDLSITAGLSFLETEEDNLSAAGMGAPSDLVRTLNASAIPVGVSSSQIFYRYMGYFARASYNYKGKYLTSLTARYDGASNLGDDYKFGWFPGVSLGWNMHKEAFWGGLSPVVSKFKLRTSYGVNGNTNALGAYQAQGSYSVGAKYEGIGGILNTVLENPELRWEEATTFDVGFDLGVIKNRINFIFDVYRKVTDNMISGRTLPMETGFGSITTNLGSIENKGLEFELNIQPLDPASPVKWDFSVNASYVRNKILKLPDNGIEKNRIGGELLWDEELQDYAWKGGLQEGGTIGELYGYKQIGLYHSDEEAARAGITDLITEPDHVTFFGGDAIFKDFDGNKIIDQRDKCYMGNIYPKWTGGIINTVSYKKWYLNIRMDYALGQTYYNGVLATLVGQSAGDLGLSALVKKSWLKPGDEEHTDIPRLYYGDWQYNVTRAGGTSLFYEKGDFLAIREVTLSYELPSQLLQRFSVSNLRLHLTGQNLGYITKYRGMSPENGGAMYPLSPTYIFGASITF